MIINYLLQASVCLIILYAFYFFLLKNEKLFFLNRIYLLSGLLLSLIIPALRLGLVPSQAFNSSAAGSAIREIQTITVPAGPGSGLMSFENVLLVIYIIGAGSFFLAFLFSMIRLSALIAKSEKQKLDDLTLVYQNKMDQPSSFFNYIFLNRASAFSENDLSKILMHEKSHAEAWHSLDLILTEFMQILFWFNPVIYFYRMSIKTQHEYAADQAVLKQTSTDEYQSLLLKTMLQSYKIPYVHSFNQSSIKKRIAMFTKQNPYFIKKLKPLLVIPVISLLVLAYSCEVNKLSATVQTISGVINDEDGNPLPGINIVGMGTTTGTVTNIAGQYKIALPGDVKKIAYSFMGFDTQEIPIDGRTNIDLTMIKNPDYTPPQTVQNTLNGDKQITDSSRIVSGTIVDEQGKPLPGVNIIAKGTTTGTVTDQNGNYKLALPDNSEAIIYAFMGLKTQQIKYDGQPSIDVTLEKDPDYVPPRDIKFIEFRIIEEDGNKYLVGQFQDPDGKPVGNCTILSHYTDGSSSKPVFSDENGNFKIKLESEDGQLFFVKQGFKPSRMDIKQFIDAQKN